VVRKPRIEIKGGLYHVITRGNNRQLIFCDRSDYDRFLLQLANQKARLPFFLYAYCLMPNHVHLLIEQADDPISRIMQRLLTSFSQYHNRKYGKSGHLLQGRYKAILCQSDQYLAELVRYIHLNPVRARMVRSPEEFEYSSHRAYVGKDCAPLVDSEPLLRHFGARKSQARNRFSVFVRAGMNLGHREELYSADEGRILGSEDFIEATKHRIGQIPTARSTTSRRIPFDPDALISAIERVTGIKSIEFCAPQKARRLVQIKEALILVGRELGAGNADLARLTGLDASVISRRYEAAKEKLRESNEVSQLVRCLQKEVAKRRSV